MQAPGNANGDVVCHWVKTLNIFSPDAVNFGDIHNFNHRHRTFALFSCMRRLLLRTSYSLLLTSRHHRNSHVRIYRARLEIINLPSLTTDG
jgi:hypothetical protein